MCSVFGAVNGNLLVGPRVLYAMGEDRLAPKALGAIHPTYHTPALAIAIVAGWAVLLVILVGAVSYYRFLVFEIGEWIIDLNPRPDKPPFDILTDYVMFGAVIFETLAVTTIFVFRRTLPKAERPYRCWGYPFVPILYLFLPAFILGNMFFNERTEVAVGVSFIVLGTVVYGLFLRR
jgi:amino acid transporter